MPKQKDVEVRQQEVSKKSGWTYAGRIEKPTPIVGLAQEAEKKGSA